MKKLLLLVIILCFTNKNYSLNDDWFKTYEQLKLLENDIGRNWGISFSKDMTFTLQKVDEAIRNLEKDYVPLIGKTIQQDLIFLMVLMVFNSGLSGSLQGYYEGLCAAKAGAINDIQQNVNDITLSYKNNNQAQIPAILNYDNWLKNTCIPNIKKRFKNFFIISLPLIAVGVCLNGYLLMRFKKNPNSIKVMYWWIHLKSMKRTFSYIHKHRVERR